MLILLIASAYACVFLLFGVAVVALDRRDQRHQMELIEKTRRPGGTSIRGRQS